MYEREYGTIRITLQKVLDESGMSKSKLAFYAELQRTQLNQYLRNEIQRVDLGVLARICSVLGCDISDVLEFTPAEKNKKS